MKTLTLRPNSPRPSATLLAAAFLVFAGFVVPAVTAQEVSDAPRAEAQARARVSEIIGKGDYSNAEKLLADMMSQKKLAPGAAAVSGSVFFEEIKACGFYPQETRIECIIDIKQQGGYGGPVETFGSTEHVYLCVDWNNNGVFDSTESVGQGSVVMHDGSARTSYAVFRDINIPGTFRTRNMPGGGATTATTAPVLNAQATLSWVFPPTGCNFSPFWGNVFRFRIRLDPIR